MPQPPADTRPLTRREAEVRRFVRARYGLRGSLALHRHALGWDLLRAPPERRTSASRRVRGRVSAGVCGMGGPWLDGLAPI